jgi:uncharacterized protein
MAGIDCLNRHQVEYNLLSVVQSDNALHPEEVYGFLSRLGSAFIQFIPIVEADPQNPANTAGPRSVGAAQWGDFLNRVFHLWRERDIGRIYIQHFDMMLGLVLGHPPTLCVHAPECGRALAVEHTGDLYSCDHFVDHAHFLGNLTQQSLATMVDSPEQQRFGQAKTASLPKDCRDCRFLHFCHGGCPKDRLLETESGKLNWLCAGYRAFYEETTPYFAAMARAFGQRRPASDYPLFMKPAPNGDGF